MSKKRNLVIEQGTDFLHDELLKDINNDPLNVTNCVANSQIREYYTSNNYTNVTCSLSNGHLFLSLTANQTNSLVTNRYVYDVILTDSNNKKTRILEGQVSVTPQVTKN